MTTPERSPQPLNVFTAPLSGCTLVEASAGTGKTWAICGLVLRLLLESKLDIQQVLVVTFTKAATAELKERIRSRIVQTRARLLATTALPPDPFLTPLLDRQRALGHGNADMAQRMDVALQHFDEAAIHTIHAWCQRALADVPLATGLPLQLQLQADDSAELLQTAQDFWRRHIVQADLPPALLASLVQHGDSPQSFAKLLRRRQAKPLAQMKWPDAIDTPAAIDLAAVDSAFAAAQQCWQASRAEFLAALQTALPGLSKKNWKAHTPALATAQWDTLLTGSSPLATPAGKKDYLSHYAPVKLTPNKGKPPLEPHPFPALAQALLEARSAVQHSIDIHRLALIKRWLEDGPTAVQQAKRQARVQAYDDLLLNLHDRLQGTGSQALATALRQRWPAALVDEFQDTDPLQYAIFQRIYLTAPEAPDSAPPLFFVGDPKQAIYSFRHADLRTYLRARQQATREATLQDNQRSVPLLVQATNALFSQHSAAFIQTGLHFRPVGVGNKPKPVLQQQNLAAASLAPLQLWALPGNPPLSKAQALQQAAHATAQDVASLLALTQAGSLQLDGLAVQASDIAILVRSHRQGALMRQALMACGVGCIELSQASLWDSTDAEDLHRVLAAVLAPTRASTVRAALATELIGLDAITVAALTHDESAWTQHLHTLTELRNLWATRGIGVMLRRLHAAYAVAARMLARPDGERRMTNLLHLAECLQQAALDHPAPEALLRWLQRQRSDPQARDSEATQLRLESDRHLVQIVTIHRSKGLEYPFVYCPFLWDGAPGGLRGGLEGREGHDADTGNAFVDFRLLDAKHPEATACTEAARQDQRAENLRLAYVALTRAVLRCTLVVGPYITVHGAQRSPSLAQAAASPLHWLLAGPDIPKPGADAQPLAQVWVDFAHRLQAEWPGSVAWQPLPTGNGAPLLAAADATIAPAALPSPQQMPTPWRMASYSSLSLGARHDAAAVDHDRRLLVAEPVAEASTAATDADDILNFPRGAAAGECLHAVFETIDFCDPTGWPAVVDQTLANHAAALPGARPEPVLAMLADVLHTPLLQTDLRTVAGTGPPALTLAQVSAAHRLNELEFTLPAPTLNAGALQALLHAHGLAGPTLAFAPLHGYLRGFIDLVFEHRGRFHVLDWKSNHLGHSPASYAAPALAAAMTAQGYHLQLLLYTLALHRWLQARLPNYSYEQHMGPGLYLFVRGVRPGWRSAQGATCGVHAWRAPLALVQALSDLLGPLDQTPGLPTLLDTPAPETAQAP